MKSFIATALFCLLTALATVTTVAQAKPGFQDGQFIVPNEIDFQAYSDLAQAEGAIVSVGTFRGLMALGQAQSLQTLLVQLDLDPGIVAFNQFNRQLLKGPTITDRFVYLMRLFSREEDQNLLQAVRNGEISDQVFLEKLWLLPKASSQKQSFLAQKIQSLMESPYRHDLGMNRTKSQDLLEGFRHLLKTIPGSWSASYLGNDQLFAKIRQAALQDRIVIVQGSLTDASSLEDMRALLKERGSKLALLDVSNVFDYVHSSSALRTFTHGLERLPFAHGGNVVLTRAGAGFSSSQIEKKISPMWTYYQLSPNNLSVLMQQPQWMQKLTEQTSLKQGISPLVVDFTQQRIIYRRYQVLSCSGAFLR